MLECAAYSMREVRFWIVEVAWSLRMMFTGKVSLDDVSGPVGVVDVIGDTYEEAKADGAFYVWLNLLNIAILLSANLGVMNLLPIPALDGGRLLFLLVEAVRRKRLDPELEGKINLAGMALLLALMTVVEPGDEVILADPSYTNYRDQVLISKGVPVLRRASSAEFAAST